jgi:polyhydroxyalkanoate synthase
VLKRTVESKGENLVKGMTHLVEDLERGHGRLALKMTDAAAFRLGETIAVTPGKVVFQNELMQLIQYAPSTPDVYKRPLLIVPPWINKFYILDLKPKNSFIKYVVDQGHTLFVISWVNPDASFAHKTFADYMRQGPLAALDAVREATGERDINLIGYCIGGTLTAATLAWMAAQREKGRGKSNFASGRVASVTFLTSLLDFAEVGEVSVFIDEEQLALLEEHMARTGYLEGHHMADAFNLLRENDLIWSFVVNNYLMGREPMPFDILHWNSDSTRMPAAMHGEYLRRMYLENKLREPGGIELAGVPIDLGRIKQPAYFLSTREDHIAPWRSTYAGARLLGGPVRFVLGASGHVAGVVNPPAAKKYGHWSGEGLPASPDAWLVAATQHPGSWWEDWARWIAPFGGKRVPPRTPVGTEDAPGSYVKVRIS